MIERLSVETTVERLAALYAALGPRLGCRLVEANAVLTTAGARGDANLSIVDPTPDNLVTLQQAQPTFAAQGIRWVVMEEVHYTVYGRPFWPASLNSLEGFARSSRTSQLVGITPFDASTGWEGLRAGMPIVSPPLEAAYPEQFMVIWDGFTLGYPDQAILDFCAALKVGAVATLEQVKMPAVERYVCAQPCFSYAPAHASDPQIVTTAVEWNALLEGVYASEWHQQLAADPAFQVARRVREGAPS
jgi:hypothetical protein